jgi:mannose-6-phosphate isomerase-like protein (cupin superfamily)
MGVEANVAEILASREQTGGTFGMWRYTSLPGGPPLHIHRAEDAFFYILSGEFNFQLGDCITRAPTGSYVIPRQTAHTFQNIGPDPGVLLGVVSPGGFEGFFMGLPGADTDEAMALMKQHHMDGVEPPLEAVMPRPRPRRQAGDPDDPNRHGLRGRSRGHRAGGEPRAAGREPHGGE